MADSTLTLAAAQKFCLEYYEKNSCRRLGCRYNHKRKPNVEIIQIKSKEGYILGRYLNMNNQHMPMCRYFLRGHCNHASTCRFRHEVRPVATRNDIPNTLNNNQPFSTNVPSTSASDLRLQNTAASAIPKTSEPESEIGSACAILNNSDATDNASNTAADPSYSSWVNAPEFVPKGLSSPKPLSYAEAVNSINGLVMGPVNNNTAAGGATSGATKQLCPYANKEGFCKYPPGECSYLHGEICDLCGNAALHPLDEDLRKKHHQDCIKQHEKNMELSFAVARSKEKSCGICFEVIMEKASGEQRFGILPNCNHCFCLTCIRKWRQARQFENKIIRACPECRVTSDFVCPSVYWVDTKEDKNKLIEDYKSALQTKDCKYFDRGGGKCPFGNKCFYRHALVDGRVLDVGPPPRQRRNRSNFDNATIEVLQQVILWDFLEDRENPWQSLAEDLEDLADFFSDSDDSEWSDYELFME